MFRKTEAKVVANV